MPADRSILLEKHAVVTGGSRGIGLGISRALSACGARVSIVSRRPDGPQEFTVVAADVGDEVQIQNAFNECRRANGSIDILVNNAGITDSAPLVRTTKEMWDRIIATNLTGSFLATRAAAPDMLASHWGRILNVASTAGLKGATYISAYCASKHGIVGFTRAIAAEVAGRGITANALCPGYVDTEMMQQAIDTIVRHTDATPDAARNSLAEMNPEGRIATVAEVADAALELICGNRNGIALVVPGLEES
ncbi:MAG: SDR family oxidoreductase [Candidatus Eremiobacteraeota bacterium]|nr:SDR family oxidoreductase [Candidatus Eremiobacteraeota bacterium]